MTPGNLISGLNYLEPILCSVALFFLLKSHSGRKFLFLTLFLSLRLASTTVCLLLHYHFRWFGLSGRVAYNAYFYIYWTSYALESVLSLFLIYSIFQKAMEPLRGLASLGTLVFRWAGSISIVVAGGIAFNGTYSGRNLISSIIAQLQQTSSVLTLCLLLFVCFAIRPLGLSYRSRIFGVSFGLGVMATASMVDSAWVAAGSGFISILSIVNGASVCITLLIWSSYFALPDEKPRIIMLPTTSPFLRWNEISAALGDEPGYVAVGGVPVDIFAPAEVEIMFRASAAMAALDQGNGPSIEDDPTLRSLAL